MKLMDRFDPNFFQLGYFNRIFATASVKEKPVGNSHPLGSYVSYTSECGNSTAYVVESRLTAGHYLEYTLDLSESQNIVTTSLGRELTIQRKIYPGQRIFLVEIIQETDAKYSIRSKANYSWHSY
eukprot:TRINITY_DN3866_c0_g1_i2.p1 TRINITY_DN3866_c0_g1~~TRINITY_DN3866_c0_g1_i2.p1  ORF type:complete len:125 (+),score=30.59 TRINITY_DN3866_c0_g1_i2:94-468(+)